MSHSFDLRRRSFLIRGLALPFVGRLDAQNTPIDAQNAPLGGPTLVKTQAGHDEFITERYHDQIAAILADWIANLLVSPKNLEAIEKALAPGFIGSSSQAAESRIVRPGPPLEVRHITFSVQNSVGKDAFLDQFRAFLSAFSTLQTA